jgi:hypothetical protein
LSLQRDGGSVGIGIANPSVLLHLKNGTPGGTPNALNANTVLAIDSSGSQYIEFRTSDSGAPMQGIVFTDNGLNAFVGYKEYSSGTGYGEALHLAVKDYSASDSGNGIYFGTSSTPQTGVSTPIMFIKASGNVGINTASPDTLYNLTTVRYAGSSGNVKLIGDTSVTGSPNIVFYNTASSTSSTLSWNGTGFTLGSYVSANGATLYSPLNVASAAVSWGETMTLYPASNGYHTIAFRLEGSSSTTGTWAIGKESSTGGNTSTQFFQIVKNGLTGGSLHRVDALQTWDPNGNSYFGFNVGIGTQSPVSKLNVNGGKIILNSDSGGYGQFQINSSTTSTEATILLSNGGSGVNLGSYTNVGVIGMGAYGGARDTLIIGTGYSSGTLSLKSNVVTVSGSVVNAANYKAHTYVQLTSPVSWSVSVTGNTTTNFSTTGLGLPSGCKALQVLGWYHITGYSGGAGQGDHAASLFGITTDTTPYPWSGPGYAWPYSSGTFPSSANWGSFVLWHDGDASNANTTNGVQYYGFMDSGIIHVNSNGNVYCNLASGYSGGTHYIGLWIQGYWI